MAQIGAQAVATPATEGIAPKVNQEPKVTRHQVIQNPVSVNEMDRRIRTLGPIADSCTSKGRRAMRSGICPSCQFSVNTDRDARCMKQSHAVDCPTGLGWKPPWSGDIQNIDEAIFSDDNEPVDATQSSFALSLIPPGRLESIVRELDSLGGSVAEASCIKATPFPCFPTAKPGGLAAKLLQHMPIGAAQWFRPNTKVLFFIRKMLGVGPGDSQRSRDVDPQQMHVVEDLVKKGAVSKMCIRLNQFAKDRKQPPASLVRRFYWCLMVLDSFLETVYLNCVITPRILARCSYYPQMLIPDPVAHSDPDVLAYFNGGNGDSDNDSDNGVEEALRRNECRVVRPPVIEHFVERLQHMTSYLLGAGVLRRNMLYNYWTQTAFSAMMASRRDNLPSVSHIDYGAVVEAAENTRRATCTKRPPPTGDTSQPVLKRAHLGSKSGGGGNSSTNISRGSSPRTPGTRRKKKTRQKQVSVGNSNRMVKPGSRNHLTASITRLKEELVLAIATRARTPKQRQNRNAVVKKLKHDLARLETSLKQLKDAEGLLQVHKGS